MPKKIILDKYEQDIEDNVEKLLDLADPLHEIKMLKEAARRHSTRKKSITLRIHERDLEAIRLKASRTGVPYQTYINMLIHRDVSTL